MAIGGGVAGGCEEGSKGVTGLLYPCLEKSHKFQVLAKLVSTSCVLGE